MKVFANPALKVPMSIRRLFSSRRIQLFVAFILFALIASNRFQDAMIDGRTAAFPGDGWGTVGWIIDVSDNVNRRGFDAIWGDLYVSDSIKGGMKHQPGAVNPIWMTIYWIIGNTFEPQNAYDAIGLSATFLIISWGLIPRPLWRKYLITMPIPRCLRRGSLFGIAGFLLARQLSISWLFAMFFGFLLTSFSYFNLRVNGHLTQKIY